MVPFIKKNRWTEIESSQFQRHDLYHLFIASRFTNLQHTTLSPTVLASLQAWDAVINFPFRDSKPSILSLPLQSLTAVIPDLNIRRWVNKGVKDIDDLMIGPAPKTFRSLQIEVDLTSHEYYTYLQIYHFLRSNSNTTMSLPWNIVQFYSNPISKTKGISLFYKMLNNKEVFTKTSNIIAWEREIGASYTSDQWQKALRETYVVTKSVNLWKLT